MVCEIDDHKNNLHDLFPVLCARGMRRSACPLKKKMGRNLPARASSRKTPSPPRCASCFHALPGESLQINIIFFIRPLPLTTTTPTRSYTAKQGSQQTGVVLCHQRAVLCAAVMPGTMYNRGGNAHTTRAPPKGGAARAHFSARSRSGHNRFRSLTGLQV